jgi:hypothetical protein
MHRKFCGLVGTPIFSILTHWKWNGSASCVVAVIMEGKCIMCSSCYFFDVYGFMVYISYSYLTIDGNCQLEHIGHVISHWDISYMSLFIVVTLTQSVGILRNTPFENYSASSNA